MTKLFVIIGVTGTQGSSIARQFLDLPGWKVRGITRNPSSQNALHWVAEGVEIVKGDLDDTASLRAAFQGANAIFANTDFFSHMFDGTHGPDTALQYAFDREVEQGMNVAHAASDPSVLGTLEHFVYSSLSDASRCSGGKYTTVYHFDSKARTMDLIKSQCPELAKRMSALQMGHYVTNWKAVPAMAPKRQPEKDTGAFVKALLDVPPGKTLIGVSEMMTFSTWMEIWGRVLDVQAAYQEVSPGDFYKDFPEPLGQELMDTNEYMIEFGYTGGDPEVVYPNELDPNIKTTSMEEYTKGEDWSSVLSEQ
ncbi:nmrA-like family domain-containing protein [Trichoderma breve]|uniref:NmrA-like family domain-containing protein n=1 Tax=Trichoderma breve TaxID=2034170 RepID=A0A9W9E7S4_9HYPO|nr:nmrA-like family domain-containing protein [Trichoderma breve]KAJ4861229.1 nmrA-like family domain-containing protein [Trichoderma breve]